MKVLRYIMMILGYIWQIIGAICFVIYVLFLIVGGIFCDDPAVAVNVCTTMFYGGLILGVIGTISVIFLFTQPVNKRTLFRIDIPLYVLPFTPWLNHGPMWELLVPPIITVVISVYAAINDYLSKKQ